MLHQNAHIWFSLYPLPSNEYKCGCMSIFNLYGQALWREITNVTGYNKRPMTGVLHALFPSCREQKKTQAAWSENTWNLCRSSDTPADNTTCTDGVDCAGVLWWLFTQDTLGIEKKKKSTHISVLSWPCFLDGSQAAKVPSLATPKKQSLSTGGKKYPHSWLNFFYVCEICPHLSFRRFADKCAKAHFKATACIWG